MEAQKLLQYIENEQIYLSEDESQLVTAKFRYKRYLKGQYVLQSGDVCKYLNFVLNGELKSFFLDKQGREHIIMLATEKWWITDQGSFTNEAPSNFDIQCLTEARLLQVTKTGLEHLLVAVPKLERFFRVIILRHLIFTQNRLIDHVSLSAKDRYHKFIDTYGELNQRFPQYLVASYLGITKEFLSKIRSER